MKQSITLNVKADLRLLKERLERVQEVEKELDSVMQDFIQAVTALNDTRVPFCLEPEDEPEHEEESEEIDRFSLSPYEYPEEFPTEEDLDPFDFGTDKDNTPFATVDDYEGLG